jgi:hypothetical protein
MNTRTFPLPANWVDSHKVISGPLVQYVKAMNLAGHRLECVIRPAKRTQEHSARLHAMYGWLSKNVPWAGELRSIDHWKRLTVAAWSRARGESVEYLPALDGKGIDIVFLRTSEMSGKDMAELIEWIYAWGAELGHDIPEYQRGPDGQMVAMYRARQEVEA